MSVISRVISPVLVSVTDCAGLVVFTVWLANVRVEGESCAVVVGVTPVPVTVIC